MVAFAAALPAYCNRHGQPLSWAHYQYGLSYLSRARPREDMRMASALGVGSMTKERADEWWDEMRAAAGL
jgi:hypothetical protein